MLILKLIALYVLFIIGMSICVYNFTHAHKENT